MPPRWLCVLIVASWLLLTGWLFYDDLLPRLLPGQPPPVTIDPTVEVQMRHPPTKWKVYQNDHFAYDTESRIEHPRRDTFEMIGEFPLSKSRQPAPLTVGPLNVLGLASVYRVNADGDLQSFEIHLTAVPVVLGELVEIGMGRVSGKFGVTTYGEVRGGRLRLTREWEGNSGDGPRGEPYAELPIARGAAVVMPLHPPKRLRGLERGQRWRAVVIDPFASAFSGEPVVVRARVRSTEESLRLTGHGEVSCLVIDYEGERVKVSTWVNAATGNVVAQEATLNGTHWRMDLR